MLKSAGHRKLSWLAAVFAAAIAGGVFVATSAAGPAASAANPLDVDLSGVCPKTIVLQIDWFPEAEYGIYYSLIGNKGTLNAKKGAYKGPLLNTGVDLEIRAGGPFIGQETVQSLMYQDDSITLGLVHTDDAVRFSKTLPVVSVVAPLEHSPLVLMWDPRKYHFRTFRDIGKSGATVLVYTKAVNYVPFLIAKGIIPDQNFDDSFDGSFARFAADTSIVVQGFLTNEPYVLEHEIKEYHRPVSYLPVWRSGYDPYLSTIAVKKSRLQELSPCLSKLVPLIQQAQVNYMSNPATRTAANKVMVDVVTKLHSFWHLTMAGLAWSNQQEKKYNIVSNGTDNTLGNQVPARVQRVIDDFHKTFGNEVKTADPDVTPGSISTNRFIDRSIRLKG